MKQNPTIPWYGPSHCNLSTLIRFFFSLRWGFNTVKILYTVFIHAADVLVVWCLRTTLLCLMTYNKFLSFLCILYGKARILLSQIHFACNRINLDHPLARIHEIKSKFCEIKLAWKIADILRRMFLEWLWCFRKYFSHIRSSWTRVLLRSWNRKVRMQNFNETKNNLILN